MEELAKWVGQGWLGVGGHANEFSVLPTTVMISEVKLYVTTDICIHNALDLQNWRVFID